MSTRSPPPVGFECFATLFTVWLFCCFASREKRVFEAYAHSTDSRGSEHSNKPPANLARKTGNFYNWKPFFRGNI